MDSMLSPSDFRCLMSTDLSCQVDIPATQIRPDITVMVDWA